MTFPSCAGGLLRRTLGWHSLGPRVAMLISFLAVLAMELSSPIQSLAAEDKKDRDAQRIQLLQQRFNEEKSQWQTEKDGLQKQIGDKDAALASLKAEGDKTAAALETTRKQRASLADTVAALNKKLVDVQKDSDTKLVEKTAEIDAFTKSRQQERIVLNSKYDSQTKELQTCSDKNQRLLKVGHELLVRYRDKGISETLEQKEPVLGFADVEMFNMLQDYRDQIDGQLYAPEPEKKP